MCPQTHTFVYVTPPPTHPHSVHTNMCPHTLDWYVQCPWIHVCTCAHTHTPTHPHTSSSSVAERSRAPRVSEELSLPPPGPRGRLLPTLSRTCSCWMVILLLLEVLMDFYGSGLVWEGVWAGLAASPPAPSLGLLSQRALLSSVAGGPAGGWAFSDQPLPLLPSCPDPSLRPQGRGLGPAGWML